MDGSPAPSRLNQGRKPTTPVFLSRHRRGSAEIAGRRVNHPQTATHRAALQDGQVIRLATDVEHRDVTLNPAVDQDVVVLARGGVDSDNELRFRFPTICRLVAPALAL